MKLLQALFAGRLRVGVRHWSVLIVWFFITGFAYQTERDIFFRLSYLLLAIIVLSFIWGAYAIATFEFERKVVTPHTYVGRLAEERFLVHNTGRFPKIWIEVRDESELPHHRASRVLNSLRARAHWTWSVRTPCRQRGRFRLGPVSVATGDPFGIFIFQRKMPDSTASMVIYPATMDLAIFSPPVGALSGGDAMQRRTHHVTTNVSGTREYVPGDSFNRIHWRSFARTDRLIVKEFELDPTSDVWIFLDMERDVQSAPWWVRGGKKDQMESVEDDSGDLSSLWFANQAFKIASSTEEYGVSIASSVAKYFLNRQRAVGFVAYGNQREIVQPDRGERQLTRLLEALAVLRAVGRTPLGEVLAVEGARIGRNTSLVVITPSVDVSWIRFVREIKRRGMHTIAVIMDNSTFGGYGDARIAAIELQSGGIPTYTVRAEDDLRAVLGRA